MEAMNSDTPETDAAVRECHNLPDIVTTDGPFRYVPADFARRLELRNEQHQQLTMTIRECAIACCRELGLTEQEVEGFLAYCDSESRCQASLEECKVRQVEDLTPDQREMFWMGMRAIIPLQVERYRKKRNDPGSSQESMAI